VVHHMMHHLVKTHLKASKKIATAHVSVAQKGMIKSLKHRLKRWKKKVHKAKKKKKFTPAEIRQAKRAAHAADAAHTAEIVSEHVAGQATKEENHLKGVTMEIWNKYKHKHPKAKWGHPGLRKMLKAKAKIAVKATKKAKKAIDKAVKKKKKKAITKKAKKKIMTLDAMKKADVDVHEAKKVAAAELTEEAKEAKEEFLQFFGRRRRANKKSILHKIRHHTKKAAKKVHKTAKKVWHHLFGKKNKKKVAKKVVVKKIKARRLGGRDSHGCNRSLPPQYATVWSAKKRACVPLHPRKAGLKKIKKIKMPKKGMKDLIKKAVKKAVKRKGGKFPASEKKHKKSMDKTFKKQHSRAKAIARKGKSHMLASKRAAKAEQ
jgi:hypothetical protein